MHVLLKSEFKINLYRQVRWSDNYVYFKNNGVNISVWGSSKSVGGLIENKSFWHDQSSTMGLKLFNRNNKRCTCININQKRKHYTNHNLRIYRALLKSQKQDTSYDESNVKVDQRLVHDKFRSNSQVVRGNRLAVKLADCYYIQRHKQIYWTQTHKA